jgi:hypothetical protein
MVVHGIPVGFIEPEGYRYQAPFNEKVWKVFQHLGTTPTLVGRINFPIPHKFSRDAHDGKSEEDLYGLLGVGEDVDQSAIKTAYRRLALQWHPDKHRDPSNNAHVLQRFSWIEKAHRILSDPDTRAFWDRYLYRQRHPTQPAAKAMSAPKAKATPRAKRVPETPQGKAMPRAKRVPETPQTQAPRDASAESRNSRHPCSEGGLEDGISWRPILVHGCVFSVLNLLDNWQRHHN